MIVESSTQEDDAKDEMGEIQPEEIQVGGWPGPENGFGDAIDPG